jgi:hypothetical protein
MKTTKSKIYRSLAEAPAVYVPLQELRRAQAADAAWFEKHLGPDVPPLLLRPRGRPKKGTPPAKSTSRTVRMADAAWETAGALAKKIGVSRNAVLQLAVLDMAGRT